MPLPLRHFIDTQDFTPAELIQIMELIPAVEGG